MILYLCILVIILTILAKLWKRHKDFESLPPGPPCWPLFGNLRHIDFEDPRKTFIKWHQQYGPIFTVWLGTTPNIFITGYDMMQELFVKRGDEFIDRPSTMTFEAFLKGKNGLTNLNGDAWKEQRRFSLHVMRNFGVGRKLMEVKIGEEINRFVEAIEKRLADSSYSPINIKPFLEVCMSNVITNVIMSKTYSYDNDPKLIELKEALDKAVVFFSTFNATLLNSFPFLQHVPLFNHFGMDGFNKEIDLYFDTIREEVEKHKLNFDVNQEPADFTDAYLQEIERRRLSGGDLTYFHELQLHAIIMDFWTAGLETTVTTLHWFVLLMMFHPDVQEKAQKEIDEHVGSERSPNMSDRASLPYNVAVMHEVQRFTNIVVNNAPHMVNKDTFVSGYKIPKDIPILAQVCAVHVDESFFPNPDEFRPERFLDADGKVNKMSDKVLVFSLGKRACVGEGLARMELFMLQTSMLQKFSFSLVENEPKPSFEPLMGFGAFPRPYNVQMTKRH